MEEALAKLMRIHYQFFMTNKRFWYDHDAITADGIIVNTASVLRKEINEPL